MDGPTIITLTILGVLILAVLVLAGLVLSARSFTQLMALTRLIGSWVAQQGQEDPPVQTTSSSEMEHNTDSAPKEDFPFTRG